MNSRSIPQSARWKEAFEPTTNPSEACLKLRSSLLDMRHKAHLLAGEIGADLPSLTIHDGSHLDGLWDVLDQITEPCCLNPAETFVLGATFLTHDLAMSRAAVRIKSIGALDRDPLWNDLLALHVATAIGFTPSPDEIEEHANNAEIRARTEEVILRRRHAENAEALANSSWKDESTEDEVFLISDEQVRRHFGHSIGRIAASHWWDMDQVLREFGGEDKSGGAPSWAPDWPISTLKLACLLRIADACHLDDRRAPLILRLARRIEGTARDHWIFQEKLTFPHRDPSTQRLVFRAKAPFSSKQHEAWWLCYEMIQQADREIHDCRIALRQSHLNKVLAVTGVAGAESPERMARFVECSGWRPIDAKFHVTDVLSIIDRFAGRELYGDDPAVSVRELLQNSIDAVRARRLLEDRSAEWGQVTVGVDSSTGRLQLKVGDLGIGMSNVVLLGPLLTFGGSLWSSPLVVTEAHGLLSLGFRAAGKYGIGFFSFLIIGDEVEVRTRTQDDTINDTRVLEARRDSTRVLIRDATRAERLSDPGTCVVVPITRHENFFDRLRDPDVLARLCAHLCPTSEITITIAGPERKRTAVEGGDWRRLDGWALLDRLSADGYSDSARSRLRPVADRITDVVTSDGTVVGRLAYLPGVSKASGEYGPSLLSANICMVGVEGGIRVGEMSGAAGVIYAKPDVTARDRCHPVISWTAIRRWLVGQLEEWLRETEGAERACVVNLLLSVSDKVRPELLREPVLWTKSRCISIEELRNEPLHVREVQLLFVDYHTSMLSSAVISALSGASGEFDDDPQAFSFALLARNDWEEDGARLIGSYFDQSLELKGSLWSHYTELRYSTVLVNYGRHVAESLAVTWGVSAEEIEIEIKAHASDNVLALTLRGPAPR